MKNTCVLIVLDGWGIGRNDESNPIHAANPATINAIKSRYTIGALQASGIAVGLPWDEVGNSEVGHLTIGAGKVIYQHYPRITLAIESKEFFKNPVLLKACAHAKKNNSALNLVGLLTEGNIHASFTHLEAMLRLAKMEGVPRVNLHLFADGKDSRPRSAEALLSRLKAVTDEVGIGTLASFSGRYYGLDRDNHWDRTEKAYRAMTSSVPLGSTVKDNLAAVYEENLNDDHMEPAVSDEPHPVSDNDALVFMDFREDSIRQIAAAFIVPSFDKFSIAHVNNLFLATLTDYSKQFSVPVAFPSEVITNPLGKVLADAGKTQMLVAETEKYAHVTYFFNGYSDEPFKNQFRILIPSRPVARLEERPEMMAEEIGSRIVEGIEDQGFDFILANFANPDMIAHTGNYAAELKAIAVVDEQLSRILKAVESRQDTTLMITSDHGNAESMVDPHTGRMQTSHDPSPVPIYMVGKQFIKPKSPAEVLQAEKEVIGILSDVAPTVLDILGLKKPPEMNGKSLLPYF